MNQSVLKNGRRYVNGITASMDGFYSRMRESKLSQKMQTDIDATFVRLKKYNILAVDMESSCMLVLSNLMGIRSCIVTITTVLENLKKTLAGEDRKRAEQDLCQIVLDGLKIYHKEVDPK